MSDPQNVQRKIDKTTVVRTIVWNPEAEKAADKAKVVQLHSTTTTSNGAQSQRTQPEIVSFDRKELDTILQVYGFKVADGEWKDYAIDMLKDKAIFSIFRRANDTPLHCIEKNPKLARKQGIYSVTGTDGRIIKRGHDLATVLKVLQKKPKLKVV